MWIGGNTSRTVNDARWHYIVGVWSGTTGSAVTPRQFTVYIDGQPASLTAYTTGHASAPITGWGGTKIGHHDAWSAWYQGDLEDVAVYTTTLSAAQVHALSLTPGEQRYLAAALKDRPWQRTSRHQVVGSG